MRRKSVLAIGELLWDVLPTGAVLGGAPANFAVRLASLDVPVTLVSRVGEDDLGKKACAQLEQLGVSTAFVQRDPVHPTGTVDVILSREGNASYTINKGVAYDYVEVTDALLNEARNSGAVCFGTLVQRAERTRETVYRLLSEAKDAIIVYDINLRKDCHSRETIERSLQFATVLKLNHDEIVALRPMLGLRGGTSAELASELIQKYELRSCLITRAEHGVLAVDSNGTVDIPGFRVKVVDTIGSGDAFTAGFVVKLLQGADLKTACEFGNKLGALVAMTQGGMKPIAPSEIDAFGGR